MTKFFAAFIVAVFLPLSFAGSADAARVRATYDGPDACRNIDGVQSGVEWWLRDLNGDKRCQVFVKYVGWVFP